ncbi:uncharacterized protein AMSG_06859 [Thecamonas trahens ATCC 50062]|uniref:Uncharacterized protein n=1 Tax=Thecamonas trahens ATCC 50062 TaxID=461836 RepID=A0A0L0DDE3_THETB|nr:hypothetical protein AMSG_06859 [Thecamonas trahens ATCC 50062]KNC50372.1 hypothetical protein AMSG_06859 [Thecamonas trahens ATCC 50062]|eukprot:XP_013756914.1 hypothetical protein AMSG_06859 [Thecamonas trahens ATCC 50062]
MLSGVSLSADVPAQAKPGAPGVNVYGAIVSDCSAYALTNIHFAELIAGPGGDGVSARNLTAVEGNYVNSAEVAQPVIPARDGEPGQDGESRLGQVPWLDPLTTSMAALAPWTGGAGSRGHGGGGRGGAHSGAYRGRASYFGRITCVTGGVIDEDQLGCGSHGGLPATVGSGPGGSAAALVIRGPIGELSLLSFGRVQAGRAGAPGAGGMAAEPTVGAAIDVAPYAANPCEVALLQAITHAARPPASPFSPHIFDASPVAANWSYPVDAIVSSAGVVFPSPGPKQVIAYAGASAVALDVNVGYIGNAHDELKVPALLIIQVRTISTANVTLAPVVSGFAGEALRFSLQAWSRDGLPVPASSAAIAVIDTTSGSHLSITRSSRAASGALDIVLRIVTAGRYPVEVRVDGVRAGSATIEIRPECAPGFYPTGELGTCGKCATWIRLAPGRAPHLKLIELAFIAATLAFIAVADMDEWEGEDKLVSTDKLLDNLTALGLGGFSSDGRPLAAALEHIGDLLKDGRLDDEDQPPPVVDADENAQFERVIADAAELSRHLTMAAASARPSPSLLAAINEQIEAWRARPPPTFTNSRFDTVRAIIAGSLAYTERAITNSDYQLATELWQQRVVPLMRAYEMDFDLEMPL